MPAPGWQAWTALPPIRHRREFWKAAFEAGKAERIMSFYAPGAETVAFNILPSLQFAG
jgi:ketosteroid isomerase-like protein